MNTRPFHYCVALCLAAASVSFGADLVEKGVTQPSARKELAFAFQGIIGKVSVKDGDTVKAGQELMRQDDRLEMPRLEGLKLDADRSLLTKAKQATLDNKRVELKRKEESWKKGSTTESEYQLAQLDVVLAEAEVELARHDGLVKQAEVNTQSARVEKLTLAAPVDGVIEKVIQTEGESASYEKASIVMVTNDPMWIEVKTLPASVVQKLKKGDTLAVRYPGEEDWKPAAINYIAPVADARAGTQGIRLEMANPEKRSTGLGIDVKIPSQQVAAVGAP